MTPELARADRAEAVRNAARSWRQAGVIDGAALSAIEARYPDDRSRVGPVFRTLLFLFTVLAVNALFGLFGIFTGNGRGGALAVLALLAGVALAFATDVQIGRLRRRQGGTEAATSLMAIGYVLGAVAWWVLDSNHSAAVPILCLTGAVLCAAAAWRWGYPLYAAAATAGLLVALAHLPLGRLLWIVLPLAAAPVLLKLSASPRLPPAHRASCTAVLCVALAALYAAVHFGSWQTQVIEEIGERHPQHPQMPPSGDLWGWLALVATALMPAVLLALGLRGRRYPLLLLGAGIAVVSLVTLRWYVHLAPLWIVLVASGAALVALVFALRRYLESGTDGERHGFTAAALFQDAARLRLLEAGAAILTLAPEARTIHEEPKFHGGGGEFGGGGASGGF